LFCKKLTAKGIGGRGVKKIMTMYDPAGLRPSAQAQPGLFYNRRLPGLAGTFPIKQKARAAPYLIRRIRRGFCHRATHCHGLSYGPEPKSLWIRLKLYHTWEIKSKCFLITMLVL
jgi:hypothetical protein